MEVRVSTVAGLAEKIRREPEASARELSKKYGCRVEYVRAVRSRERNRGDGPRGDRRKHRIDQDTKEACVAAVAAGEPIAVVAKRAGVSAVSVRDWTRRAGVEWSYFQRANSERANAIYEAFLEGESQRELARNFGCTPSNVSQIINLRR